MKTKIKTIKSKIGKALIYSAICGLLTVYCGLWTTDCFSQAGGIGISVSGADPDNSAILDVSSTDQGMLIPRVNLTSTTTAAPMAYTPLTSLVVYNQATAGDVTPGFYYWDGSKWVRFTTGISATGPTGPTGANGATGVTGATGSGTCSHTLGESYEGGVIFALDYSSCHGLIGATGDQSTSAEWGCMGTSISGTYTFIMAGPKNTTSIDNGCTTSGIAADICQNLTLNTYNDWFLPSKDELYQMLLTKNIIGGFAADYYWSSSEISSNTAWMMYAPNIDMVAASKEGGSYHVRCVRAF